MSAHPTAASVRSGCDAAAGSRIVTGIEGSSALVTMSAPATQLRIGSVVVVAAVGIVVGPNGTAVVAVEGVVVGAVELEVVLGEVVVVGGTAVVAGPASRIGSVTTEWSTTVGAGGDVLGRDVEHAPKMSSAARARGADRRTLPVSRASSSSGGRAGPSAAGGGDRNRRPLRRVAACFSCRCYLTLPLPSVAVLVPANSHTSKESAPNRCYQSHSSSLSLSSSSIALLWWQ